METCFRFLRLRPPAFDEGTSEDLCPLFAIWLRFTHNLNIRGHALLQVNRELGIGNDVGVPVTGSTGFSRQVVGTVKLVEVDLDAALFAGLSSDRDDIGDPAAVHGFFDC